MLSRFITKDHSFLFVDAEMVNTNENVYTIIVGKNGTGKSSLLSSIVREYLGDSQREYYTDSELGFSHRLIGHSDSNIKPEMVIAISTSPFDKFPINKRQRPIHGYAYLGLRDLMSANFGFAYMSKIIASLIDGVISNANQTTYLGHVLNYLGFTEIIHAQFNFNASRKTLQEMVTSENPFEFFLETRQIPGRLIGNRNFFMNDGIVDEDKFQRFLEIVRKLLNYNISQIIYLEISSVGILVTHDFQNFIGDLSFLIEAGILRLRDFGLQSSSTQRTFSIKDASSGEQSVILSMLGIASRIKDNSLVCIDEPEVCLHPEWQEKYIQILVKTFSMYKHCHFVIATHSPQIISRLSPENCFILNIESRELKNARDYINNSADFQLANIFNAPGYKNEYLSRIALNIFAKVGQRKKFDEDDLEKYRILENQSGFIDDADPVNQLFGALKKLHDLYA
jgi:predicted ATPase